MPLFVPFSDSQTIAVEVIVINFTDEDLLYLPILLYLYAAITVGK